MPDVQASFSKMINLKEGHLNDWEVKNPMSQNFKWTSKLSFFLEKPRLAANYLEL